MEELVLQLWDRLDLSPPCDLGKVCSHFGIQIVSKPLGDQVSALYLTLPSGRAEIVVNASDSPVRRRFSIAHELGHHVLSMESPRALKILSRSVSSCGDDERQATEFAARLLMPGRYVVEMYEALKDDPRWRLSILSERFQVSRHAMRVRLRELGLPAAERWKVTEITQEMLPLEPIRLRE